MKKKESEGMTLKGVVILFLIVCCLVLAYKALTTEVDIEAQINKEQWIRWEEQINESCYRNNFTEPTDFLYKHSFSLGGFEGKVECNNQSIYLVTCSRNQYCEKDKWNECTWKLGNVSCSVKFIKEI